MEEKTKGRIVLILGLISIICSYFIFRPVSPSVINSLGIAAIPAALASIILFSTLAKKTIESKLGAGFSIVVLILAFVFIIWMFVSIKIGPPEPVTIGKAYNDGCTSLRTVFNCDPSKTITIKTGYINMAGQEKTLAEVCIMKDSSLVGNRCAQACGCPV
jgi:hypothetical protein